MYKIVELCSIHGIMKGVCPQGHSLSVVVAVVLKFVQDIMYALQCHHANSISGMYMYCILIAYGGDVISHHSESYSRRFHGKVKFQHTLYRSCMFESCDYDLHHMLEICIITV